MALPNSKADQALNAAMNHYKAGNIAKAEPLLRRALHKTPGHAELNHLLGMIRYHLGDHEQAAYFLTRAIATNSKLPKYHNNYGNILSNMGRPDEARAEYEKALALDPKYDLPHTGLANLLSDEDRFTDAAQSAAKAVAANPNRPEHHATLANTLLMGGRLEESLSAINNALAIHPKNTDLLSIKCILLNHVQDATQDQIFEAHKTYGHILSQSTPSTKRPATDPTPDRKLRIGYISPDFRTHSVAYFIEPILANHNTDQFHITCYHTAPKADQTTERLKQHATQWRDAANMSPPQLAEQIRSDKIDILIDLAGHTVGARPLTLAIAPAPIIATYLGYPNTTGIPTVNYRIIDELTDPEGSENFTTESLYRLPGCFLCYKPLEDAPEPSPLPSQTNNRITFGSFNSLTKITDRTLDLWTQVLKQIPSSRLILKNTGFNDLQAIHRTAAAFKTRGIDPARLDLLGPTPTPAEHLALYSKIDIALDTFPYAGTTTTIEAMWMGVPVISLIGKPHASRVGLSLLTAVGLPHLAAQDQQSYITTVCKLAADTTSLANLRSSLRQTLADSDLCNATKFSTNFETMLRTMWTKWCDSTSTNST